MLAETFTFAWRAKTSQLIVQLKPDADADGEDLSDPTGGSGVDA